MATAGDFARRALTRILVESPEDADLDPTEYADALSTLNRWMADREANGIRLGYTPVTNVGDDVTIPLEAEFGVECNLAVLLAGEFGGIVSPLLARQAMEGEETLRKISLIPGRTNYPDTLPMGSGNDNYNNATSPFYDQTAQALTVIRANDKATDIPGALQYAKAEGHWSPQVQQYLIPDVSGRIRNAYPGKVSVKLKATLYLKGSASFSGAVSIHKNGRESLLDKTVALTTTPAAFTLDGNFDLQAGDFIEVWVSDILGVEDVTLVDGRLELNRDTVVS